MGSMSISVPAPSPRYRLAPTPTAGVPVLDEDGFKALLEQGPPEA